MLQTLLCLYCIFHTDRITHTGMKLFFLLAICVFNTYRPCRTNKVYAREKRNKVNYLERDGQARFIKRGGGSTE